MNLDQMQKNFTVSNYFLFKYNLKFEKISDIVIDDVELEFPN